MQIHGREIGIISPYQGQVRKIRDLMNKKFQFASNLDWKEVTVGSTEQFQGQERKVIIISTVRSQVENLSKDFFYNLGFIGNPKR
jgi:helicase MOV-10